MGKTAATLLLFLAIGLILVGLKFTSISSGDYNVQNDGYNVTGGFMTLAGGFIAGYLLAKRK